MKYSVPFIYDTITNNFIDSETLLSEFNNSPERKSDERTRIMKAIKASKPLYLCGVCQQPVYLCGGRNEGINQRGNPFRHLYFKHFSLNDDCPFCSKSNSTFKDIGRMKFHGQKEGPTHLKLKQIICSGLKADGYNIYVEKRVSMSELYKGGFNLSKWRVPDVRAEKGDLKFVLEIQLATTFLSVIIDRMNFYKEFHYYLLWILEEFDPTKEQHFTTTDILSLNNRNIFVLDEEMQEETRLKGKLTLKCYYERPKIDSRNNICYDWNCKIVHIEDIIFDDEHYIGYCYDSRSEEKKIADGEKRIDNIHKYQTPKEKFSCIVNSEIVELYNNECLDYKEFPQDIICHNWKKIEKSLDCLFYKKRNIPIPSKCFFNSLLALYRVDSEYNDLIRILFSHPIFIDFSNQVFCKTNNPFDLAWTLTETCDQLLRFFNLFHISFYYRPKLDVVMYTKKLNENMSKDNTKLLVEKRFIVEKCILVIMYSKIENHVNHENLFRIFNDGYALRQMMRLAAYSIGHPLYCELSNIQSMSSTFLESNKEFAHLAIKMIDAYGWKDDIKFYNKLKIIPKSFENHDYDELAQALFKK